MDLTDAFMTLRYATDAGTPAREAVDWLDDYLLEIGRNNIELNRQLAHLQTGVAEIGQWVTAQRLIIEECATQPDVLYQFDYADFEKARHIDTLCATLNKGQV